jgi:hypothetical protein
MILHLFLLLSVTQGVLFGNNGPNIPTIGKQGGLLQRSTDRPTEAPTSPPTREELTPTAAPTESPAPSPSPSGVPTADPDRITITPTSAPTESPAPSPSPSMTPTSAPSSSPTGTPSSSPTVSTVPSSAPTGTPSASPSAPPTSSPSAGPTKSVEPSSNPTDRPSDMPSDFPSLEPSSGPTKSAAPSENPSSSPSSSPSTLPSSSPTDRPSDEPSSSPSFSPTKQSHKTKTAITSLLLEEISSEMDYLTAAEFEIITLEFLRKKITPTMIEEGYDLDLLAVNVLLQNLIFPETPPATTTTPRNNGTRHLESETWSVALVVDIRTVGVVMDGRVAVSFNFTEIVDYTFYNHWDQYLWQLGNAGGEFFSPLLDVTDWEPQQEEEKVDNKDDNNGSFVVAVLFSFIAFSLAVCASYIAIRKHMLKQQGGRGKGMSKKRKSNGVRVSPKNSQLSYSGPEVLNYLSHTMSDNSSPVHNGYHDGDVEGGGALAFVRSIDVDDLHNLENVALTPRGDTSPSNACLRNGLFVVDEVSDDGTTSPLRVKSGQIPKVNQDGKGLGGQLRKWLTPRQGMNNGYSTAADANKNVSSSVDRNDPPENESTKGYNYAKTHNEEPDAVKASTKNQTGVYTSDKSTIDGLGGRSSSKPTSTATYKDSRPASEGQFTLPISFFSNRGTGADGNGNDSPMSSLADSNASSFFAIGNTNKDFTGRRSSASAEEDTENQQPVQQQHNTAVPSLPRVPNEQAPSQPPAVASSTVHSIMRTKSTDSDSNVVKRSVALFEGKQTQKQDQVQQQAQQPLREIQPANHTSVGEEMTLGARSRDKEDDEQQGSIRFSHSYEQSRSVFSPTGKSNASGPTTSNPPDRLAYGYAGNLYNNKARSEASTSTLGARPMEKSEDVGDDMTTLSNIMNRSGSYDVYAPSGPIGIVVDTSKEGPSVHSLKSTSPMMGLISPGDLIVALDGEDTRKMSAAALTRLMAKKSRQKERKITLYSQDGF